MNRLADVTACIEKLTVVCLSEVCLSPEADLTVVGGANRVLPGLPVPRVPGYGGGGSLLHHAHQQLVVLVLQLPVATLQLLILRRGGASKNNYLIGEFQKHYIMSTLQGNPEILHHHIMGGGICTGTTC